MPYGVVDDVVSRLRECRDCGLFHPMPELAPGEAAHCSRCGALLRHRHDRSLRLPLVCLAAAGVLFLMALYLPLMGVHAFGHGARTTLLDASDSLFSHGAWPLGVLVLGTLVVAPAVQILGLALVLIGVLGRHEPHPHLAALFGWLLVLRKWAMPEVFLIGAFVAYTRLASMADVDVGLSVVAVAGVMLAMVGVEASLDRQTVWSRLAWRVPLRARPIDAKILGCDVCRLAQYGHDGDRCARCFQRLEERKKDSMRRTASLVFAAAILYVPANLLPVMTATRLGHGGPSTILNGVVELFSTGMWPLGLIVAMASFAVPLLKLVALGVMLFMTHRGSQNRLVARTRLYRVVEAIGRWSMIDIFVLAVLVALVRLGALASVEPNAGATAFASVVLLTMIATESFDPRLMWDAAHAPHFLLRRKKRQPIELMKYLKPSKRPSARAPS
jgi:paraquat-inducible protein A